MKTAEAKLLFTYPEAAQILSISMHTVKKYVRLKKIETVPMGRAKRIHRTEIERVAKEGLRR